MNKKKLLLLLALVAVVLFLVLRNQPQNEIKQAETSVAADYQFKTKSEMQHFTEDDYNRICDMLEIEYKTKILNEKENKIKEDF